VSGPPDLKLPDGRLVPQDLATDEEIDLAVDRLQKKSLAHTEEAERLLELRRSRETDDPVADRAWLTRGVAGIGGASFLADVGHEVPTALLPSFLTTTLGASAAALGLIEGIADGCAGAARFTGGALADDPERRRKSAVGGYTATAVFSSLIGVTTGVWQVGVLRAAAWSARGLRVPARNALLADVVPKNVYGKAYGFERMMDNLGAIGGPLLASLLVALIGVRSAMLVSVIPGLLATLAIVYAIRATRHASRPAKKPIRFQIRPVLKGELGKLFFGIGAFEVGNVAATLLILRAVQLLSPSYGSTGATQIALWLYIGYNAVAAIASVPGGHLGDRRGSLLVLTLGAVAFAASFVGFAVTGPQIVVLAVCFGVAGLGIAFAETAEHAAVANHASLDVRGSAFGALATIQSLGNFAASAVAGLLFTVVSPRAAFVYLAAWMIVAVAAFVAAGATKRRP
jgi:MFS family permease